MLISQRQNHLSSSSHRIKQTAQTNRVWVKATINRGHILGPMKILTLMIREDKMQLPKQTEFGLKKPLTENTPSGH